jgi:glucokinase
MPSGEVNLDLDINSPASAEGSMSKAALVGVDIGGTKTAVVLSTEPPAILRRIAFPTNADQDPKPTLARIEDAIREVISAQKLDLTDLRAIGVSCGSPLDDVNGVIQSPPNLPAWRDVPIKAFLEDKFKVKCFLGNDANAGALAERAFGAARGTQNMVFLTLGTGIGAGLILNGQLYQGASKLAGEIGHVRLTRSGPVGHNKKGTVEGWVSGAGMAREARRIVEMEVAQGGSTSIASCLKKYGDALSARDIWEAAQSGDHLALSLVAATGERLGEAMAILVDILNPECIVIGGLAVRMGEALLGPARAVVAREALAGSAGVCRIVAASLGEQIGDVAALCVALEGLQHVQ